MLSGNKKKGFSIVEVIIAIAIMTIIIGAMYSALDVQRKELARLGQKLAVVDLKNQLVEILSQPKFCKYLFKSPIDPSKLNISIDSIYDYRLEAWNSSKPLVDKNSKTLNGVNGVSVVSMGLSKHKIVANESPDTVIYSGYFNIDLKSEFGPLRGLEFEEFLFTYNTTSSLVTSCQIIPNLWQDYPRNLAQTVAGCEVRTDNTGQPFIKVSGVEKASEFYSDCFVSPNGISYNGTFKKWD